MMLKEIDKKLSITSESDPSSSSWPEQTERFFLSSLSVFLIFPFFHAVSRPPSLVFREERCVFYIM